MDWCLQHWAPLVGLHYIPVVQAALAPIFLSGTIQDANYHF